PAFRVALTDFGLMRWLGQAEHTSLVVGTPAYIPPEVVTSDDPELKLTLGADVYGLGVTAYEMLTGEVPYPIETVTDLFAIHGEGTPLRLPSEVRPDLAPAFDDVLIRALAREPGERFRTPLEFRNALLAARAATSRPAGTLRIVIADDDPDFRDLAEAILQSEFPNASIECVSDGHAALVALDRRRASLAVVDLDMPRMNGVELTAALRASRSVKELAIIVVTGHGGAHDWGLLSQLGADGFIVKPLDPYSLIALARRVLGRSV
ncbi:MAG: response regulator, partial [Polyangiaceae bacterium]|nr:response regulator [Polyangiaceae bacterium]